MKVTRVPESDEAEAVDEDAPADAQISVETGCGSCHTPAASTNGTVGPNHDEETPGAAGIRD
jgi:mono/diheme cytochrome c family protein